MTVLPSIENSADDTEADSPETKDGLPVNKTVEMARTLIVRYMQFSVFLDETDWLMVCPYILVEIAAHPSNQTATVLSVEVRGQFT